MKKRVQMDSSILSLVIVLTGFLYAFPSLYSKNWILDTALDCLGLMAVLAGNLLRMSSRGHKKAHSQSGRDLVTSGPYQLVRNPMYLGSFLMGAGFVFIVWPWWCLPIFAWLFYLRFNKEITKEETHLAQTFGEEYKTYCRRVPRLFPSWERIKELKPAQIFAKEEILNTKEKRGLIGWPLLAVILESFQEWRIFEQMNIQQTVLIFAGAYIVFFICFQMCYRKGLFYL